MELISVIIPLYNAELFVEKAYSFIVNQKMLKIPIEIIFVDNNSSL
jgi:glycosyltransferase involved in cell wall biosynthesis